MTPYLSIALPRFNRRAAGITNREEETLQQEQRGRILNLFQRSQKLENLELWVTGMAMNGAGLIKFLQMLPKTIKSLTIFGYESFNWWDEENTHEENTEFNREFFEIRNEKAILFDDLRQILQSFPKLEQINFERMLAKGAPLPMSSKEFRLANNAMIEELSKQGRIVNKIEFSTIPASEEPF